MQLRQLSSLGPTVELLTAWDRLAGGVPFRSWPWLASWWDAYGTGRELLTLAVEDNAGELIGLAPWYVERRGGGRVLRMLGGGEVCSDYVSGLSLPEHRDEVVAAIAGRLIGAEDTACPLPQWDLLELDGVELGDPFVARLAEELSGGGCRVEERPGPNCWQINLPNDWDDYLAEHSKSHRKQIRRVERRLLDTGAAQLHTVETPEQLDRAWEVLVDLHQRRRESLGQVGCFRSPRFSHFLRLAAERLLREGKLELHWVELENRPVAAEFHVTGGGVTYAYQAGVDPDALDAEPGCIINIATIKRAIELGRTGFDFLRGDEPYKAHWRAEPRPTTRLRIVPPRTIARMRHGVQRAGEEVKGWVKSGLSAVGMYQTDA